MNIAFYFSTLIVPEFAEDNIFDTPDKWPVYKNFLEELNKQGAMVYVVSVTNYQGDFSFSRAYLYSEGNFILQNNSIKIDTFLDRSKGSHVPPEELIPYTYNNPDFKKLASNKIETEKFLGEYMKISVVAEDTTELEHILAQWRVSEKLVIKPAKGMKGKGIFIDTPQNLLLQIPQTQYPYLAQEFIDTSKGIPGLINGVHDLRIVAINGKLIMAVIRTPALGSLLANVAQGGGISEIPLTQIPQEIMLIIEKVFQKIESRFPGSSYSMDFGVEDGVPYLFEINDRVGFPRDFMPGASLFAKEIANALIKKSRS